MLNLGGKHTMPLLEVHELTCAVCGRTSSQAMVGAAPPVDAPDFDTRPGGLLRDTLPRWVAECPHCGYAAAMIAEADARAAAVVRDDGYQQRRKDETLPEGARRFAAHALLLERLELPADAGWTMLHAAWMCDDAGAPDAARHCRGEAIRLWKQGKRRGMDFMEDQMQEFALVTDVLRRLGDFDAAREAALEGLTLEDLPPVVEDLLRRQLSLIQQKDTAAHSLRELERPRMGERVTLN